MYGYGHLESVFFVAERQDDPLNLCHSIWLGAQTLLILFWGLKLFQYSIPPFHSSACIWSARYCLSVLSLRGSVKSMVVAILNYFLPLIISLFPLPPSLPPSLPPFSSRYLSNNVTKI